MKQLCNIIIISAISIIALCALSLASMNNQYDNKSDKIEIYPEIIKQVAPTYPESAKKNGYQGKTYISAHVDKSGKVIEVKLEKSSKYTILDQSALDAVENFIFKPAIQDGKPVNYWVTIPVEFKLSDQEPIAPLTDNPEIFPEMISQVNPVYPVKAKQNGIEGDVWVKAYVAEDGTVTEALIQKSSCSDCGFDESALKAALLNKFKPAIQDGKPLATWVTYKVSFKLDNK